MYRNHREGLFWCGLTACSPSIKSDIRDRSLITGRRGAIKGGKTGGGGQFKFYPHKKGGGQHNKFLCSFNMGRLSFSHAEGGGGTTNLTLIKVVGDRRGGGGAQKALPYPKRGGGATGFRPTIFPFCNLPYPNK